MKTEFEIKFMKIDKDEIRKKLKVLWAKCVKKETLMKRVIYDLWKLKYARIRDEWDKITCTYKEIWKDTNKIDCVKEIETTVWDFDKMKQIFEKIWAKQKSYQETKREIWKIENECEFMIDTWPWLNPFLEIEAESEEIVKKYVEKLWFDFKDGVFWAVDEIASIELWLDKDYINSIEEITFEKPLNKLWKK